MALPIVQRNASGMERYADAIALSGQLLSLLDAHAASMTVGARRDIEASLQKIVVVLNRPVAGGAAPAEAAVAARRASAPSAAVVICIDDSDDDDEVIDESALYASASASAAAASQARAPAARDEVEELLPHLDDEVAFPPSKRRRTAEPNGASAAAAVSAAGVSVEDDDDDDNGSRIVSVAASAAAAAHPVASHCCNCRGPLAPAAASAFAASAAAASTSVAVRQFAVATPCGHALCKACTQANVSRAITLKRVDGTGLPCPAPPAQQRGAPIGGASAANAAAAGAAAACPGIISQDVASRLLDGYWAKRLEDASLEAFFAKNTDYVQCPREDCANWMEKLPYKPSVVAGGGGAGKRQSIASTETGE